MSDLSEHDRAELERIELELMAQDPRLARLLGAFGRERPRRRRTPGRWLISTSCCWPSSPWYRCWSRSRTDPPPAPAKVDPGPSGLRGTWRR